MCFCNETARRAAHLRRSDAKWASCAHHFTPDHFWRRNWLESTHVHALDRKCARVHPPGPCQMRTRHTVQRSRAAHISGLFLDFALLLITTHRAVAVVYTTNTSSYAYSIVAQPAPLLSTGQHTITISKSFETVPNPNRRRIGVRCHKKCISYPKLCMRFARFASYLHSKVHNSVLCTDVSDFLLPSSYGNKEEDISPANVRHFLVHLFGHSETGEQRPFHTILCAYGLRD